MCAVVYVEGNESTAICSIPLSISCILLINSYSRIDHRASLNQSPDHIQAFDKTPKVWQAAMECHVSALCMH